MSSALLATAAADHPGRRGLDAVLRPDSIVVIGASHNPSKRGHQTVRALQQAGYEGRIELVNPKGGEVLGLPVRRSLNELKGRPDLAVIATPAATVADVLEKCGRAGIRGAVVLAGGFGETSGGVKLEAQLAWIARAWGMRVVGPNTSGLANPALGLDLLGMPGLRAGGLAVLVQSGNIALELLNSLQRWPGAGLSVYVGVGNETDVHFHEYLAWLEADPQTQAIIMYVEGMRNGRAFLDIARSVTRRKPVVLLKGGRSAAGRNAARSHTGALAGADQVFRAAMADAGVIQVRRADELLPVGLALASQPPAAAGGIVVLSDGGGHATLAADRLSELRVPLPELAAPTAAQLRERLGANAAVGNPVDVAGAADRDPGAFVQVLRALISDPTVGGVLMTGLFGGYALRFDRGLGEREERAARELARLARQARKPLLLHSLYAGERTRPLDVLDDAGIPVFGSLDIAARSMAALCERREQRRRPLLRLARTASSRPIAFAAARREARTVLLEPEARELVAAYGVEVVPGRFCTTREETATAAAELAPAALKVVSAGILHKTEAGGVLLDVRDADAAARGFALLHERANGAAAGVLVARMLPEPAAELLVGAHRDAQFGPVLTVGLGGITVELMREVQIKPLPVSRWDLRAMFRRGRLGRLLRGMRNRPAADISALVELTLRLGDVLLANEEVEAVECNPVFAYPDRAVAVDVRVLLKDTTSTADPAADSALTPNRAADAMLTPNRAAPARNGPAPGIDQSPRRARTSR